MMQAVAMRAVDCQKIEAELRRVCPRGVRLDEPMSKHTTFGAGGKAWFFAAPHRAPELVSVVRTAVKWGLPYMGVGRGSNLLVRDGGYEGLIIQVAGNLAGFRVLKRTAHAEAGLSFTKLGRVLTRNGRPGFEFAVGIPGSVGGAVRMNAGAFGSELSNVFKSAKLIDGNGKIVVLKPEEMAFRYRGSTLPPNSIVLSAIFHCPPGEIDEVRLQQSLGRKHTQPLSERTFGSTFRNPRSGYAGQMIEACGLKGERRGGAMVSKKHANFMVNVGEGTRANDVEDLIEFVADRVEVKFGVRLKPEVIIIGNR
jgi:UDP-N-acetylmuramate dehydrogenase